MSDLQIGLILVGVVLILAVLVFNWWQDRRIRQKMQEHFPEGEHDPLMGARGASGVTASRREPGLGMKTQGDAAAGDEGQDDEEIDPRTEVVIDVSFGQAVGSSQLQPHLLGLRQVGNKPVRVFAQREGGGYRVRLRPDEQYASLQLAVLLANRSGALTDIEWSQLWTAAESLAERFDGIVEGPEPAQILKHAQQLDALFADLDAQVGLVLQLARPQGMSTLLPTLEAAGFLCDAQQVAWMSEFGIPRFTVLFDGLHAGVVEADTVSRLDFVLDVPNSPADEQAFSRMATVGRDLATRLGAVLLDDQGQALPDHADDLIDKQLLGLYQRLEQAGYPAGHPDTSRVFS